jgi:hypothetical protein
MSAEYLETLSAHLYKHTLPQYFTAAEGNTVDDYMTAVLVAGDKFVRAALQTGIDDFNSLYKTQSKKEKEKEKEKPKSKGSAPTRTRLATVRLELIRRVVENFPIMQEWTPEQRNAAVAHVWLHVVELLGGQDAGEDRLRQEWENTLNTQMEELDEAIDASLTEWWDQNLKKSGGLTFPK